MKKKKHYLKTQIIIGILLAILLQSAFFGMMLASTGGFSELYQKPFQVMESHLAERNADISDNLNLIFMEGLNMKQRLAVISNEASMQQMILDTLNRVNSISGIFCVELIKGEGVYFKDSAPETFSVNYSDIYCTLGNEHTGQDIALSKDWEEEIPSLTLNRLKKYVKDNNRGDYWIYMPAEKALYYMIYLQKNNGNYLVGIRVGDDIIHTIMGMGDPAYDGMQFMVMDSLGEILFSDVGLRPIQMIGAGDGKYEKIYWKVDHGYIGLRCPMQFYGKLLDADSLYMGVVCKKEAIVEPVRQMLAKVILSYLVSLLISIVTCGIVLNLVFRPLNGLLKDIRQQKARQVHFGKSSVVEIDSIYQALNAMTKRLSESYSRYDFAMEEVEENIGSFVYEFVSGKVLISKALEKILDIPKEDIINGDELTKNGFVALRKKLIKMSSDNEYTFTDRNGILHCVVMKTKQEEKGIFGVTVDRSEDYRKITEFRYSTEHDFLTKIYNASYLKSKGKQLLENNKDKINAMLFCDLDNLKHVNDSYGHNMGDAYIVAMADKLSKMIENLQGMREGIAARVSGDEFAVLLTGFDSKKEIQDIVAVMHEEKHTIQISKEETYPVKASIGIAFADKGETSIEELLKKADSAMYIVKHGEKDQISIYEE